MLKTKEILENFIYSRSPAATAAKVILALAAVGGIVLVGAIAPNVFSALGRMGYGKFSRKDGYRAFYNLKNRKLIETIREDGNKTVVRLTKKGERKIREFAIDILEIKKPKRWDRRWRIMIFDIPNYLNKARRALTDTFKDLGLYQLQKSVWVYPYPCEDEVLFVANFFGVDRFIEVIETETFLNSNTEYRLKKFFKLITRRKGLLEF